MACPVHGGAPAADCGTKTTPRPVEALLGVPLGELLGAGGFATVWRLGADRVAKIAHVSHDLNRARIAREAEALEAVGAPAVPALHASGILDDGRAWLVMDRVDGATLADRMADGRSDVAEATRLGIATLDALAKIHAARFVHRDLKPDNLARTGDGRVVILDLGLARKLPRDPSDPTRAGVQVGSLEYMPPEQLAYAASVDERSDLYAFGCVLFELLAGRPPFVGDAAALERAHAALRPPRLGSLVEVPVLIDELVHDCLAKDPARRPASAARARAMLVQTRADVALRTGSYPISIIRESQQPVVLLYAELPRIDRALLGMFAAHRLVIASQKGRRVVAGALGGEHGDPAALALAAAHDLVTAGARVALHLEALRVTNGVLLGEAVAKPETWIPATPWTGVVITRSLAAVIQAPTREAADHPGFRAPASETGRAQLIGREALLADIASDAAVALLDHGSRSSPGGPGFALLVGEPGVGKTAFGEELGRRLAELGVRVHTGTVPLPGAGKPSYAALGDVVSAPRPASLVRDLGDGLRAAAREAPLAVILDDLHLADHDLLDALEYATLGGEPLPLWVLGLAAPRLDARRPNVGVRAERHRRDVLGPLDDEAAVALAAELLRPAEYPPLRALRRLTAIAQGNPLHLATLAREIHERGAIRVRGGAHFFDTSVLDELSPAALGPWLAARELAGLPEELVALARICAVLAGGGEVGRYELTAVVDSVERAGGATTTIDAAIGLRELAAAGLLTTVAHGSQFRRALVEEGVYATTGEAERRAVHRAALEFWRARGQADVAAAARVARHAEAVGEAGAAARAYGVVAQHAHAAHRLIEAEQAREGELRNLPATGAARVRALIGRAEVRSHLQRTDDAIADLDAAVELAAEDGDVELQLEADFALARACDLGDDYDRSREVTEAAVVKLFESRLESPHLNREATLAAARMSFRAEAFAEAAAQLRDLLAAPGDYETEVVAALLYGPALAKLGELPLAEQVFATLIARCRASDDLFHLCAAYGNRCWLWSANGKVERAAEDLRLAIQVAREAGLPSLERVSTWNLAEDRLWQGSLDESLQLARRSLALQAAHGRSGTLPDRMLLARILAARGERSELPALLDELVTELPDGPERAMLDLLEASTTEAPPARWGELLAQIDPLEPGARLELLHLAARHNALRDEDRAQLGELVERAPIWAARVHELDTSPLPRK
ncbi:MAG: protein kinase [Deltaproteobacteria bacterium]